MNGVSGAIKVEDTPLEQAVIAAAREARVSPERQSIVRVGEIKVHAYLDSDALDTLIIRIVRKR